MLGQGAGTSVLEIRKMTGYKSEINRNTEVSEV
jgi:hypothetical protein